MTCFPAHPSPPLLHFLHVRVGVVREGVARVLMVVKSDLIVCSGVVLRAANSTEKKK